MRQTEDGRNDEAVAVVLPWAAACLALLHCCVVTLVLLSRTGSAWVSIVLVVVGVGAAAAQGSVASLASRDRLRGASAHAVLAGCLVLLSTHAALVVAVTGDRAGSAVLALTLVAAGGTLVRLRWMLLVCYASWALWLLASLYRGTWTEWPSDVVTVLAASLVGAALSLMRRRELQFLDQTRGTADAAAVRDALTGLSNKQGLTLLGNQLLEVARRQGDAVHCVLVDIDAFERLNAELGAEVGDDVLVAVAEGLRSVTRSTDVVARWSIDEFAIVGPGPGMAPLELERRIRERLAAEEVVDPRCWDLGITAGGAMLAPWDSGPLDVLLERAENELSLRRALRRESSPLPRRVPPA